MHIKELLISAGLTEKEAQTYLILLSFGSRSTSFIAQKAKLNRGTTYLMLHSLLEKGLVAKTIKNKVQYFSALDPKQLIAFLEHKNHEIQATKEQINNLLPEIRQMMNPLLTRPKIQFFEGVEGARNVLDTALNSREQTLRAFLSLSDVAEFIGADYLERHTKKRIEKGLTLHVLRSPEKDRQAMLANIYARSYISSKEEKRLVRYVPEKFTFPMTMYLFDQTIAVLSSKDENFSLLIESRELCEMQKSLFMMLWETATCS